MKIYTKSGDKGTTALLGGTRVPKHHFRIEAYGTIDELNSWVGLIADQDVDKDIKNQLHNIQDKLFTLGAFLATDPEKETLKSGADRLGIAKLSAQDALELESAIDRFNEELPPMTHFILPGGHPVVSSCHIARTVCRRAERRITVLHEVNPLSAEILTYINRLSDFLFVLARKLSLDLGIEEIKWVPKKKR